MLKRHSFISLLYSVILLAGATFLSDGVAAKEKEVILIVAASNLQYAMDDIIRIFERKKPGVRVKAIYGSSGNFFNQILNGAPFDLYFSADPKYPDELKKKNLGSEVIIYASGRIVVMTRAASDIEIQRLGLKSLFDKEVKKIAVANPAHAPYGKAAVAFMKGQNIFEKLKDKLVMGENISQAAQFVESGAAEVGIIALSLAIKAKELGRVSYWEIPAKTYRPIKQGFIILKRTKKYPLVREFADFVQGREGTNVLLKHGFDVPVGSRQSAVDSRQRND